MSAVRRRAAVVALVVATTVVTAGCGPFGGTRTVQPRSFRSPHPVTEQEGRTLDSYDSLFADVRAELSAAYPNATFNQPMPRRHYAAMHPDRCWLQSQSNYVSGVDTDSDAARAALTAKLDAALSRHGFPPAKPAKAPDQASIAIVATNAQQAEFQSFGRGSLTYYVQLPLPWSECA